MACSLLLLFILVLALTSASAEIDVDGRVCVVTQYSQMAGAQDCSRIIIRSLKVPVGGSLKLHLKPGSMVKFEGITTFAPSEKPGRLTPLISIAGTRLRIFGASGHRINGNGQAYWDTAGGNEGKLIDKPKFLRIANLESSRIESLHIVNAPVHVFSIQRSRHVVLDGIKIDNSLGDTLSKHNGKKLGHNTDAFDVGESSDITIANALVHNQDDCLAVNSGARIRFLNGTCIGGHGLSIGSVGGRQSNVVRGVLIADSRIVRSENGIRIKTKAGKGKGEVSDVTFSNIALEDIAKRGIVVQQDYENSGPTGRPGPEIHISDLKISRISGNVQSNGKRVYVLCAKGGCTDWKWSNIDFNGGGGSVCQGTPDGIKRHCS